MNKVLAILTISIVLSTYFKGPSRWALGLIHTPKLPQVDMNYYWGPGNAKDHKEDKTIRPFKIAFPKQIEALKAALSRSTENLRKPLEGTKGFERGFNSNQLQKMIKFWRDDYLSRWDERQAFLNRFPQFRTQINGIQVHFIHVKPQLTKVQSRSVTVLPLLLLHGFPSSIREFYEIIPMLTTPNSESKFVFEIVAPSLPGFGWTEGASKQGLGPPAAAVIFKNLMSRLGHEKFVILGGDWGGVITSLIATLFPKNVLGAHSSICRAVGAKNFVKLFIASLFPKLFLAPEEVSFHFPLKEKLLNVISETGFFHLQATKPDTVGAVLTDNPVGLLAYLLDKFSSLTNLESITLPDGGLEKTFSLDSLIDNVMIYYLSNSISTSVRFYYENFNNPQKDLKREIDGIPTNVPFGCVRFKNDLVHSTNWQLKDKFTNLVHSSYIQEGGHFPVLEMPGVVYNDFMQFVKKAITSAKPISIRAHDLLYNNFMMLVNKVIAAIDGQKGLAKAFGFPDTLLNNLSNSVKKGFGSLAGEL